MHRNRNLDGLRGLAALNVVLCHHIGAFYPSLLSNNYPDFAGITPDSLVEKTLSSPPITLLFNGHAAVVIFFVLSGYVLTIPSSLRQPGRTIGRLLGRPVRLGLPTMAACIVSAVFLFYGVYGTVLEVSRSTESTWLQNFYQHPWNLEGAAAYTASMGFYWQEVGLVPPLWTLRIELLASVYLLLALVLLGQVRLFAIGAFLAFSLLMWPDQWPYYLAFALGSLISYVDLGGRWPLIVGMAGLYFSAFQGTSVLYSFLPIHDQATAKSFYNVLGATLLVIGVKCGWLSRLLDGAMSQFLGKISYSLYLIHFPILGALGTNVYASSSSGALASIVSIAGSIVAAWALAVSVDRLAIEGSRLISRVAVSTVRCLTSPTHQAPKVAE